MPHRPGRSAPFPPSARQRTLAAACKQALDRKSTRLNSSHSQISYAVFCLKKKTEEPDRRRALPPLRRVVRPRLCFISHKRAPTTLSTGVNVPFLAARPEAAHAFVHCSSG